MKVLVTGGGGFLGSAVVRLLLERGVEVRSFARGAYPWLAALGVDVQRGDLADAGAVAGAVDDCTTVFHVAAKAGLWGPPGAFHAANVQGTRNVLVAARRAGVERLIYTSTPSVVHGGGDIEGGDESLPYARTYDADYPRTKAVAEGMVLAANGPQLATTALRPHLVWGPGDTNLVPRLLARARAGRLRLIGGGHQRVDATYVDNAAQAHLDAADRLHDFRSVPAGRAYFVANDEPTPIGDLLNRILGAAGLPPERRSVPLPLALAAGAAAEGLWRLLRRSDDPPITRFLARQLGTAHWFDLTAARRDLGYAPAVSSAEGFTRLAAALAPG